MIRLVISLGLAVEDALAGWLPAGRQSAGTCVVINYHSISGESKSRFGKQLDMLLRLAIPLPAGRKSPLEKGRRYVAVTVDDVFQSFLANGLPELCQRKIPVTLFPPTGYLGRNSSWDDYGGENKVGEAVASADDLRQIAKFNNVDFGSHGVTHANLALLAEAEARQELQNSKRSLESIVGREITALSFPYGSYGARELRLASETGYKVFFDSTPQRLVATVGEGLTGRVGVQPTDWDIEFSLKIRGAYRWVRMASAWKKKARAWFAGSTPTKDQNHG
ncbi:MAG: polysaccharide deacetylase family protein [Limisphaerales bacterium]